MKMTHKLEKHCNTNDDEFGYDGDNSKAKNQRKHLRRSSRLHEKLANKENTKPLASNLNKSQKASKTSKMDKENNQKVENIKRSGNEVQKKADFTDRSLRSKTSYILPDFENMLVAGQVKKPPVVVSNVRTKRMNAVLKTHGGNYGNRFKRGRNDSALLEVVLIGSKLLPDNSKNEEQQTDNGAIFNTTLIETKEQIEQLQVDAEVVKETEQKSAEKTDLLDKSTQTKQAKRLPTAGLPVLSATAKRYKPTGRYGKIYRQSIWRTNAAINSLTYSEQLKNLSKFERHRQLQKRFAKKRRAANKRTSILPDDYPQHFKSVLTNSKTAENPIGNGDLQITAEVSDEANAVKAVTPSTLSLTSSSPSLPESLRGIFETDNIGELLHVERIVYRLNDFHVKVLAEVLEVKIDYLNAILDTIVDLAHPDIIQKNQVLSSHLENAKTTEAADASRDDSSVILSTP